MEEFKINTHDSLSSFHDMLEKFVKDNYLYTRRVNIPMLAMFQNIYEIQLSLNDSFAYRGGFNKND